MRQMKDSGIRGIGQIPKEWKTVKIKYLADGTEDSFIDGDWIETPDIATEGIRYLTSGNIGDGMFKRQGDGYISCDTFKRLNCKYAYPGDIVFSRLNAPYGRSCILPNDCNEYVIAVDNVILRTAHDNRYICYITQTQSFQHSAQNLAHGAAMKRISRTNLGNIKIQLPTLPEQQKIADFLDKKCGEIDMAISEAKASIQDYKLLKQSIITGAVTKGLNPNVEMKDSGIRGIGQIPKEWKIVKIKHLADGTEDSFIDGDWIETPDIATEGIRYLTSGNIGDGMFKRQGDGYISCDTFKRLNCKYAYPGDIVFSRLNAPYGRSCILPNDCNEYVIAVDNVILRTAHDNRYICYITQTQNFQHFVQNLARGTAMKRISRTNLGNIKIQVPTLPEQQKIADFLDKKCAAIDSLIFEEEQIISELEAYKKSLIFEYVTGKKEIV